jgi:hypothetical protein
VVLLQGKSRIIKEGNPLVYNGAIKEVIGSPEAGSLVYVQDHLGFCNIS